MDWITALSYLNGAVELVGVALQVREFFKKNPSQFENPDIANALAKLPKNATADEIVKVLTPFYLQSAGDVTLKAGNNNGGDMEITDTSIEAGSGKNVAGKVTLSGGDGGAEGQGGKIVISRTTIKGGDLTG